MFGFFLFVAFALFAYWALTHKATVKGWFKTVEKPSSGSVPPAPPTNSGSNGDNSAPPGNAPPAA